MLMIVLIFATFLFYQSTLHYYFISDDFFILFYDKIHPYLFKIDQYNNHYTPIIWLFISQLYKTFGLNPIAFHLVTIFVHLINICLVYHLAKIVTDNKIKSILSSLFFTFFFGAYEVVFWFGAINNSLMVTFYLLSILSLIKYIKNKTTLSFLFFQVSFIMAYFTHEYALSIIPTAITYWWLFTAHKKRFEFIKLFSLPVFTVILTTVLKTIMVKIPLMVRTPSLVKFTAFTLRSFVYLFIPNPYIVDNIPNFFIPVIFLIILFFLIKSTRNKLTLFLLIWATVTIIIYSFTSAPQARYFYLSFIPVIIYILSIVKIKKFLTITYLLFIFVSGVIFLHNQKLYWYQSSEITKNVIKSITKYKSTQNIDSLYFVNLPDSSNDSIWKAYVFRFGFKELLTNVVHIYPKKIIFLRSFTPTSHTIEAPYLNPSKLKTLINKNTFIFVYQENLKNVVLLK